MTLISIGSIKPIIGTCSLAFAMLLTSATAWAQTEGADIRTRVKEGQKVSITDTQGQEFNGKIGSMTPEGLSILGGRSRADIPYSQIVRIDRPHDGLANGALIGFGIGAGFGFLALAAEDARACDPGVWFDCSDPNAGGYAAVTLIAGGLGAALGVGIDALIRRDRGIYRRGAGTRMTLAPALTRGVRGAVVGVSW